MYIKLIRTCRFLLSFHTELKMSYLIIQEFWRELGVQSKFSKFLCYAPVCSKTTKNPEIYISKNKRVHFVDKTSLKVRKLVGYEVSYKNVPLPLQAIQISRFRDIQHQRQKQLYFKLFCSLLFWSYLKNGMFNKTTIGTKVYLMKLATKRPYAALTSLHLFLSINIKDTSSC